MGHIDQRGAIFDPRELPVSFSRNANGTIFWLQYNKNRTRQLEMLLEVDSWETAQGPGAPYRTVAATDA